MSYPRFLPPRSGHHTRVTAITGESPATTPLINPTAPYYIQYDNVSVTEVNRNSTGGDTQPEEEVILMHRILACLVIFLVTFLGGTGPALIQRWCQRCLRGRRTPERRYQKLRYY